MCKKDKNPEEFYLVRFSKNAFLQRRGRDGRCKLCYKAICRKKRKGFSMHKKCIFKLGGKCKRCGIEDSRVLQIDHTNGGGRKELKAYNKKYYDWRKYYQDVLSDEEGKYQVLCANCNQIKRYENKEGMF